MCVEVKDPRLITEFTVNDLKQGVDKNYLKAEQRKNELRRLGTSYEGLVGSTMVFRTFSSKYGRDDVPDKDAGRIWTQEVELLDLPEALRMKDLRLSERVRLAISGDVAVKCNCPAFVYWGFGYIVTQLSAGKDGETYDPQWEMPINQAPGLYPGQEWRRRNWQQKGTVCKHLYLVLEHVGPMYNTVAKELRLQGIE